jgi:PIN domain nuclease of toxin-antitoxin system
MNLLIDSHVLIWWLADPELLSGRARSAVEDPLNAIYVSAVTGYEIELKRSRDRLLGRLPHDLEQVVLDEGFMWFSITPGDTITAGRLPLHHRDPWDRLLVAQAIRTRSVLVSADEALAAYGLPVIW